MIGVSEFRRANLATLIDTRSKGVQKDFAEMTDLAPGHVSQMINATRKMGDDVARRIEDHLGLPPGSMDYPPAYFHAAATGSMAPSIHGDGMAVRENQQESNIAIGPSMRGEVPLINYVQAGHAKEVVDHLQPGEAERWIPSPVPVRRYTYALRVRGDSMEPAYREGMILIVEPEAQAELGNLVIAKNGDGEAIFKKWVRDGGRDYLKSLNPAYPLIPMDEDYEIIGVVKFAGEFL